MSGTYASALLIATWAFIGSLTQGVRHPADVPPQTVFLVSLTPNSQYALTSVSDGVSVDIDRIGVPRRMAWPSDGSDVALLVVDLPRAGKVAVKQVLTGTTVRGVPNCFLALQHLAMETNGGIKRGSISSDDPIFASVFLWYDVNRDGQMQPSELRAAAELLSDIGVGYEPYQREDANGNTFLNRGWVHVRTMPGRNESVSADDDLLRTRHVWQVALATK